MKPKLIILDAGHGGLIEGQYQTSGKRYHGMHRGRFVQLAEGVYNKMIVFIVAHKLHVDRIPVHVLNPENEDISLRARVIRANQLHESYNCLLISIHQNAFEDTRAYGVEFFTSIGETKSDHIAEWIASRFSIDHPDIKLRKNTIDPRKYSKDAGYRILMSTRCPAVLTEFGFMTNDDDRDRLLSNSGIMMQANFLANRLTDVYHNMM